MAEKCEKSLKSDSKFVCLFWWFLFFAIVVTCNRLAQAKSAFVCKLSSSTEHLKLQEEQKGGGGWVAFV